MTNAKRAGMTEEQRTKYNLRKQGNKSKNKKEKYAKEQAVQTQVAQPARDNTAKPSSGGAPRKPVEAPAKPSSPAPAPQAAPEEPHVPMNNFNATEIEALLNASANEEVEHYKPDKPTPKAGGAWGAKRESHLNLGGRSYILTVFAAGTMANGKDFWLELRRQVTELQANGGVAKSENKKQGG